MLCSDITRRHYALTLRIDVIRFCFLCPAATTAQYYSKVEWEVMRSLISQSTDITLSLYFITIHLTHVVVLVVFGLR